MTELRLLAYIMILGVWFGMQSHPSWRDPHGWYREIVPEEARHLFEGPHRSLSITAPGTPDPILNPPPDGERMAGGLYVPRLTFAGC